MKSKSKSKSVYSQRILASLQMRSESLYIEELSNFSTIKYGYNPRSLLRDLKKLIPLNKQNEI